jgi:hypothetical protein
VTSGIQDSGLLTRYADTDFALGACGIVVLAIWRHETRPDGVVMLSDYIQERSTFAPKGIVLMQVIEEHASAPSPQARKALADMHVMKARLIRRSAVVYTKPGFAGATARAIITGISMMNPPSFDHEIFASVSPALDWLVSDARVETPKSLERAIARLRSTEAFAPRRPTPRANVVK